MKFARTAWLAIVFAALAARAESVSFKPEQRAHWAFQKIQHPKPPQVENHAWIKSPIDAFILKELAVKNISPSPAADKTTLIRRATLDLIGLPPTPAEVEAFLNDTSSKAFARVVDRLLASPQYGEHWARHWLDLARFAESEGFKEDETRPNAWRYRDYVIRSLNRDKPYDRFLREQIAGDELWPTDPDALIATGFNRHYPDESNARVLQQRRQEILNDITDTVGAVFTGMTYGCARCHNHKFDPILQADYYRLQAFFANTAAADEIPLLPAKELNEYRKKLAVWQEKTKSIRDQMNQLEAPERKKVMDEFFKKYPTEIKAMLTKPAAERTPYEKLMVQKADQYLQPGYQYLGQSSKMKNSLHKDERKRWDELQTQLDQYKNIWPGDLPVATGIADLGRECPPTFVAKRGNYENPGEEVPPGFLTLLAPGATPIKTPKIMASSGRRTALANLLADPKNPLTARVMANRIWQYHFGRGLVATPSDFGMKGERPTHPELLDWLASEFMAHHWSLKEMHRLIMNSSVYQESSLANSSAATTDPENKLLWHFPRQRLEGEEIRDAALAISGLLDNKAGGPSVFPELPEGLSVHGGWNLSKNESDRNRRSIYIFVRRNTRYPMFDAFDEPDTHESCPRRNITTTPIQALTLLNSELTLKWARAFAGRITESTKDPAQQIDTAFRLAFSRPPDASEKEMARQFMAKVQNDGEPLADLCHMLINANEFVYRN